MQSWKSFLTSLESELGKEAIDLWLRPLKPQLHGNRLEITAHDSFGLVWLEEHFLPLAQERLCDESGNKLEIALLTTKENQPTKSPSKKRTSRLKSKYHGKAFELKSSNCDPQAKMDELFIHDGNKFAFRALELLIKNPTQFTTDGYNPLYLYAEEGIGLSWLLMAATNSLIQKGHQTLYVSGERFTQHVVEAIRLGSMQEFRKFYRSLDILIVDGVEIFSNKAATQEEFFHTFNSFHIQGKPIILGSKSAPKDLKEIEARLISRFEWGLMIDVLAPKPKEMPTLISRMADRFKITFDPAGSQWILEKFKNKPKTYERALSLLSLRLAKEAKLGKDIKLPYLQEVLAPLVAEVEASSLTSEKLVQLISDYYGVTTKDLLGKCQMREFCLPRQVAMYLCRKELEMPFLKIAELFGRDHSTVMASCKLITKQLLDENSRVSKELPQIVQKY